ncbi:2-(1,2-epoxy-1,2-dihydrophenyl)acetyl-CoA isomerase [Azospirillum agricola]|uniref:enoyl-CoA hydratase/isomerase family protein n=1 Tax=Azospirillum agricola TaxID=1720247 RepID=UPI001AEAC688|nr:enoyl-CoA hydratase-related protein [Azospirillum agricola]MBP2228864.1 2-(1,2-epoxy-1,2-dihydrophenyl)acetyl-CoA isomerase [Azospirillum agricola]
MTEAAAPVLLSREGAVSWIRLNRPAVLNALDEEMAAAFLDACRAVAEDSEARVLVVAGNGRGFMAGGDLARFNADPARAPEVAGAIIDSLHAALRILDGLKLPVLASVHGPVAGAGMSVACAADLCIAADDAAFNLAYARIGATPDGSGTYHLPRLVGLRRAMELAMLSDSVDAAEALRLGLVNKVVPAASLAEETAKLAARLAAGPTVSYAGIRRLMRQSWTSTLDRQLDDEGETFRATAASEDFREGIAAFLAKRKPVFRGR